MYGKSFKLAQFLKKTKNHSIDHKNNQPVSILPVLSKFTNELFWKKVIKFIEEKSIYYQHLYHNPVTIRITLLQHYSPNWAILQTSSEKC